MIDFKYVYTILISLSNSRLELRTLPVYSGVLGYYPGNRARPVYPGVLAGCSRKARSMWLLRVGYVAQRGSYFYLTLVVKCYFHTLSHVTTDFNCESMLK
jgi:hypothetical protein